VSIDHVDGRAGMAAITPEPNFDLNGLRDYLVLELPVYARPLFIRIQPAIETTGTFKYRKLDLVREGFNPTAIEQALYFDHPTEHAYKLITRDLYAQIQSGAFKL
jgi:fatty-acyl-CoA synthase